MRTSLDVLYHSIYECTTDQLNVCEWIEGVAERLQILMDYAALNMARNKERRHEQMNKGSKLREFDVDDKVLYRVPGLSCKLSDS